MLKMTRISLEDEDYNEEYAIRTDKEIDGEYYKYLWIQKEDSIRKFWILYHDEAENDTCLFTKQSFRSLKQAGEYIEQLCGDKITRLKDFEEV